LKIIEARSLDSIADYEMRDAEMPVPNRGEVVIEVVACGVGYVDSLVSLGRYQVKPSLPHVPGQEVAGRVCALGEDVAGLAVGDRVMATVRGGFAQLARAAAPDVWRIPPRMKFAQAAGFRVNYLTALHALRDRARLAAGERLAVLGAAGGVGMAAVQVGRVMGARVIAVASSDEKRAYAIAHGAHVGLDTSPEGWRDRLKAACGGYGPDVVFDPVCGPLFEPAFRSLTWGGRHLVVGFVGGPIPALRANLSLMKGASMVGVDVRQFIELEPEHARSHLRELLEWAGDGRLDPPAGREFAFDDFRAALEFALTGQGLGKTVLRVSNED
jgi:NADPH:quinone reductase